MTKKQFMLVSVLPAFIILILLSVYPIVEVIHLSLIDKSLIKPDSGNFVGLANFSKLLGDRRFWNALKITLYWEAVTVSGSMAFAIGVAVLIYRNVGERIKSVLTLVFIMPAVLPRVAAAYTWRFMYSPFLGIFNHVIILFGGEPVEFLGTQSTALLSVAVIDIWQWGLLLSVIILGVLESIPEEPIEAAQLDGVNKIQLHRHVTLPIIGPSLVSILFLKIIESFRTFDLIYILTKGGPGIATETIDLYAYSIGLAMGGRISYGAVISFIMLIVTVMIASFLWRILPQEE